MLSSSASLGDGVIEGLFGFVIVLSVFQVAAGLLVLESHSSLVWYSSLADLSSLSCLVNQGLWIVYFLMVLSGQTRS